MTIQEQIIDKISKISEQDQEILLIIINRFIEKEGKNTLSPLQRLNQNIKQIRQYLPSDFNPKQEYEDAMREKYESAN